MPDSRAGNTDHDIACKTLPCTFAPLGLPPLYARLPANGSELVLCDLNRNAKFGPLLRTVFCCGDRQNAAPPAAPLAADDHRQYA